jgi:hypothetical protein
MLRAAVAAVCVEHHAQRCYGALPVPAVLFGIIGMSGARHLRRAFQCDGAAVADFLRHAPLSIRELSFSLKSGDLDGVLAALRDSAHHHTQLRRLRLAGIGGKTSEAAAAAVAVMPRLRYLELGGIDAALAIDAARAAGSPLRHIGLNGDGGDAIDWGGSLQLRSIAVRSCTALRSAALPASLRRVSSRCFHRSGLAHIDLAHTQVSDIGAEFAAGSRALATVALPPTLAIIGPSAFAGCAALVQLDLAHTAVALLPTAFCASCAGLATVVLPPCLARVGDDAFSGCAALRQLDLGGTAVVAIGGMFALRCTGLAVVRLPATLEHIGPGAFNECPVFAAVAVGAPSALRYVGASFGVSCPLLPPLYPQALLPPEL